MKEIKVFNSFYKKSGTIIDIISENNAINVYVDYGNKKDFFGIKSGIPLSICFESKDDEKYILEKRNELLTHLKCLKKNDIMGQNAQDVYDTCIKKYGFKKTGIDYFKWGKLFLSLNATKEGYSVQMLPHSNWTNTSNDKDLWTNKIDGDGETVREEWKYISHYKDIFNDDSKRLIFAKNKYGAYVFLGEYKCSSIDRINRKKTYTRISERYQ